MFASVKASVYRVYGETMTRKTKTDPPTVYVEFINRVRLGRSVHDVAADEDMPAQPQFHRACKSWPVLKTMLKDAYQVVVETASYKSFHGKLNQEGAFRTKEDVIEYLSGDKVTCLRCGREFTNLGPHLRMAHEIDPKDYRQQFHIPQNMGLCGRSLSKLFSENTKERHERGEIDTSSYLAVPRSRVQRPHTPYHMEKLANGNKLHSKERRKRLAQKCEVVIQRVRATGDTLGRVCSEEGMPSENTLMRYCKENPEFAARLLEARKHKQNELYRTIQSLRDQGRSVSAIKAELGVSNTTIYRALSKGKKESHER